MLFDRRSVLIGLGLAGTMPVLARAAIDPVLAGTVAAVTGASTGVQPGGERRELAIGSQVFLEDTLGTAKGARLGVRLGKSTNLQLGERTRVRIDKFLVDRGGELVLERGAMMFDRPSDEPSGEMSITTPFGLIAARGTKFFAGPMRNGYSVFVEHGLVEVKTTSGAVTLTDGLGTDIPAPGDTRSLGLVKPSDPTGWSVERISQALAMVN